MSHYQPSDNELNAYVDGELDAATRAQVADAIAADHRLAQHVARLTALKAALPDAMPALPAFDLDARAAPANDNRAVLGRCAAVAALVFAVAALGNWVAYQTWWGSTPVMSWRAAADVQHRNWAEKTRSDATAALMPVAADGGGVAIPDLSSAQLTLTAFGHVKLGEFEAFRLGYSGTRGCRISLFVLDRDTPAVRAGFAWSRGTEFSEWLAGERRYVLLSIGMDRRRFEHLAAQLEAFTQRPSPFDAEVRQQFARAKKAAQPCIG